MQREQAVQRADVAFLIAMNEEIEGIFDLGQWTVAETKPFEVYARWDADTDTDEGGYAFGHGVRGSVIVHTGIGTTNAAAAAQYTLDRFVRAGLSISGLSGALTRISGSAPCTA